MLDLRASCAHPPQPAAYEFPAASFESFRRPFSARAILGSAAFLVRGQAAEVRPSNAVVTLLAHLDRLAVAYSATLDANNANSSEGRGEPRSSQLATPAYAVAPSLPVFMLLHSLLLQLDTQYLRPFYSAVEEQTRAGAAPVSTRPPGSAPAAGVPLDEGETRRALLGACAALSCLRILSANLRAVRELDVRWYVHTRDTAV